MNRFSLLLHVLLAAVLNLIIEMFSRHSVVEAFRYMAQKPLVFLYNTGMIFVTLTVVYFFRRRFFVRFLVCAFWIALGLINGILLNNRVTPFNGADLKVALDAVTLIHQYLKVPEIILLAVGVVLLVLIVVLAFRLAPKYKGKRHILTAALLTAASAAALVFVTNAAINARILSSYFGNIAFAYQDYGFPYCFYSSIFRTGLNEPEDYSEEEIARITDGGAYEQVTGGREDMPNIIIVQLESFFDPTEVEWLEFSKDPIPNFRKLTADYSSGYFKVPSVGAGTANTEFEVLTGLNMRSFGPGEYPYKTVMKKTTCESAAYALKNFGYSSHALHNNGGNFYSRAEVFANMGFDSYTSKEFMNILQFTEMGWAKDDVLIPYMTQALDSTSGRDFLFTITVQGHGSYPQEQVIMDPEIQVTSIRDEEMRYSWEYFVNQQHEVDQFIGDLIDELERRGEPTVCVFYGDHLPTMNLKAEDLACRYLYNTQYVIWDNIGLPKKDQNLFSYQLTAEVMNQLDLHAGTVFNYHQNRRKTEDYLADLELLQYDILYGNHYAYPDDTPYAASDMEMGLADAVIEDSYISGSGALVLTGTNFTAWSKIYINGDKKKTRFYNDRRIATEEAELELEDGDVITVSQVGSKNTIFRTSRDYIWHEPPGKEAEE